MKIADTNWKIKMSDEWSPSFPFHHIQNTFRILTTSAPFQIILNTDQGAARDPWGLNLAVKQL